MELRARIEIEEDLFPKTFTNFIEKDYGILFYNEKNKDSFDSNHALIYKDKIIDLVETLNEISEFYLSKDIKPSIYQATGDLDYFNQNSEIFLSCGYKVWSHDTLDFMVLKNKNKIVKSNELEIKILNKWDDRIATDICIPSNEEHEIEVMRNSIHSDREIVFVGYKDDKAVAITYIHESDLDVCRFDYILISKDERFKGYAKELLSYVVDYCRDNKIKNCFAWPAHDVSYNLLCKAGFESIFNIDVGRASYVQDNQD